MGTYCILVTATFNTLSVLKVTKFFNNYIKWVLKLGLMYKETEASKHLISYRTHGIDLDCHNGHFFLQNSNPYEDGGS